MSSNELCVSTMAKSQTGPDVNRKLVHCSKVWRRVWINRLWYVHHDYTGADRQRMSQANPTALVSGQRSIPMYERKFKDGPAVSVSLSEPSEGVEPARVPVN